MRPDSSDEAEPTTRDCVSGSQIRPDDGKPARLLKSDSRLHRCASGSARFRMKADQIDAEIRTLAQDRRLPDSHLERWLAMDPASRGSLLIHAQHLGLRTGQLVSALELLEEIAVRKRITSCPVLSPRCCAWINNEP